MFSKIVEGGVLIGGPLHGQLVDVDLFVGNGNGNPLTVGSYSQKADGALHNYYLTALEDPDGKKVFRYMDSWPEVRNA